MKLSIIVPVYNELHNLRKLLPSIYSKSMNPEVIEIIVVDGQSEDDLENSLEQYKIVYIKSDIKQRAAQMNLGVMAAKGDVYFFLHADSFLPLHFDEYILWACLRADSGCFRMKFDKNNAFLAFYGLFTCFSHEIFHGGDASLFVKKEVFNSLNGFNEEYTIMEDYEFNRRLRKKFRFTVLPLNIITSARKYDKNGFIKLQWHYIVLQIMFRLNKNQSELMSYYSKNIK